MTKSVAVFALALAALSSATPAAAAPPMPNAMFAVDAAKILAEVDRRAVGFADQRYDASMEIIKGGQLKKTLGFTAVMKGADKQLLEFNAPGDVKGMKVLMEDADTLYLYLPEFKKVRRVAAHVQNQGFLGSEFYYSDMKLTFGVHYNAEFGGKDGSLTTLVLTPKQGVDTGYAKIELTIDGSKGGVTKIRYFDASGADVREQNRTDWIKIGDKLVPSKVSMLNIKTGDLTVITLSNIQVDQGVDDAVFSRRELLRG